MMAIGRNSKGLAFLASLALFIPGLRAIAGETAPSPDAKQSDWQNLPLDQDESAIAGRRAAFGDSFRAEPHDKAKDLCMFMWAVKRDLAAKHLKQIDPTLLGDIPALNGRFELQVEGTGAGAIVRYAKSIDANVQNSWLRDCVAKSLEGPIAFPLPSGKRFRLIFPVLYYHRTLVWYRNKYRGGRVQGAPSHQ